ncbi:MAG: aminotransferase class V-fold PLP-dependent enzyme [candidate division WOR-3 bacterium]|nr:aminotransferase class V-fold PLP-dependent enzyme [candidate division WOR-3 bacterium]MCX7756974.1 aminotransferase class V-fold PLP-dependent enzyme [candidate division WOR-3 bacterium]MDW7987941.1 aminotransferase class V-fold PLP-dependent enzyme [candidate division WOR-3 bacterium]
MRRVYLDSNSTTRLDPRVLEAMLPFFKEYYGNPSNIHNFGRETKEAIEQARKKVSEFLKCDPLEIVFTSSGTESDNLALIGTYKAYGVQKDHLIISAVEHNAVRKAAYFLKKWHNVKVTELPVDRYGQVDPDDLQKAITDKTYLVSIMHVNNEVGTIQPIKECAEIAHKYGALFHTDAVASAGKLPLDVNELGVDLLTISAHKIHGPKGVGALYIRRGVQIESILYGGEQEFERRPGTENVPGIIGLGEAVKIADAELKAGMPQKIAALRDYLEAQITNNISEVCINGHPQNRVSNVLNVGFAYIEGEALLLNLDLEGIAVSSGSACSSGSGQPSHVLLAMRVPLKYINAPVRFSLDKYTTQKDLDYTIEVLIKVVKRLRAISPLGQI